MEKLNFLDEKVTEAINEIEHLKVACQKKVDILYDKTSNDSLVNWGITSGILGGTTILDKDFSKYKSLIFYLKLGNNFANFLLDLVSNESNLYSAILTTSEISSGVLSVVTSIATVNANKTTIGLLFFKGTATIDGLQNYFCYKIEGVCN